MVVGVRHLSEKECKNGILAAILGSSAWVQVPRAVLAVVQDDEDLQLRHVRCVIGNRLPPDTPGRMFRIEGVLPDGFENEVTRATWAATRTRISTRCSPAASKEPTKSDNARELILDILENEGEQESDALDARVASETGLAARTARDVRMTLGKRGWSRRSPTRTSSARSSVGRSLDRERRGHDPESCAPESYMPSIYPLTRLWTIQARSGTTVEPRVVQS